MTLSIGIDIGNQKCVVALYRDGVVDAVLNAEDKRETPTVVQFARDHRLFGGACERVVDPRSAIDELKRLVIGFDIVLDRLPYTASFKPDGSATVEVRCLKEPKQFTAVQILAMLLLHMKREAERTVGSKISTCVIGMPAYMNERHREAYLEAAAIAGLGPCKLVDDGLATATEYGIYRITRDTINVVFVDIGHCGTQVTVVRFEGEKPKVLGCGGKRNLGGRDFDEVIYDYCLDELKRQYGAHGYKLHAKGEVRLRTACEKAKKVLSVNRDAQISVDSLVDAQSEFRVVITKEDFEERSQYLLTDIEVACREALHDAGLKRDDIRFVELVGSGTRIPAISGVLREFFQLELSRTLNGSECVARGCALRCEEAKKNQLVYAWDDLMYAWKMCYNTFVLKAQLQEKKLLKQDRAYRRSSSARNRLESNILCIRNELQKADGFEDVLTELDKIERWIYESREVKTEAIYEDRIKFINSLAVQNGISCLKINSSRSQESDEDNEDDSLVLWQHQRQELLWKSIKLFFIFVWYLPRLPFKLLRALVLMPWNCPWQRCIGRQRRHH